MIIVAVVAILFSGEGRRQWLSNPPPGTANFYLRWHLCWFGRRFVGSSIGKGIGSIGPNVILSVDEGVGYVSPNVESSVG